MLSKTFQIIGVCISLFVSITLANEDEIHPGLKNAIDAGDIQQAKNLVEKVGVNDIYCPVSLSADDADKIYASLDTMMIGWCFRKARGCYVNTLIDSTFFEKYMEKHCTSTNAKSKRICSDWTEYANTQFVYNFLYKWHEEGKQVCQNIETMETCKWLVSHTKTEYRMKFFRQLESKNLLKYKTEVRIDTTITEVIPKKECRAFYDDYEKKQTMAIGAKVSASGLFNFPFGSCYFDGTKKSQLKCVQQLREAVNEVKKDCDRGKVTRKVEKKLKRTVFVVPLEHEISAVQSMMNDAKWYQMDDEWWNDYKFLTKYLETKDVERVVSDIKDYYSHTGDLDITDLVRNCKTYPDLDKKVQKTFGFELFSCRQILEKYPAYIGKQCDVKESNWATKLPISLNGKDSVVVICEKQTGTYRLSDNGEQTTGMTCENPTKSWIDSSRTFVCDKKLGKFREAYAAEKNAGRVCENPTESWLTYEGSGYQKQYFVCDKKLGTYRSANEFEEKTGKLCEDPTESWIDSSKIAVCDKKIGSFRKMSDYERNFGLCEDPSESWIARYRESYRKEAAVCDKKIGGYREATNVERLMGKLCEDPEASWIGTYVDDYHFERKVVCDKKIGGFRDITDIERELGLCENPTQSWVNSSRNIVCDKKRNEYRKADDFEKFTGKVCENPKESWIDSTKRVVCDKKKGEFRLASGIEQNAGLCLYKNQKKEALEHVCLDGQWKKTKYITTKDLKFENKKIVKDKNNSDKLYFKDFRDGQIYRAVKIGWDTWMAENLNYESPNSTCDFCDFYGRTYNDKEALTVCPEGWRLPTFKEWEKALDKMGGNLVDMFAKIIPEKTTDKYGFSALTTIYWTSDKYWYSLARWQMEKDKEQRKAQSSAETKSYIRCIKD